MAKKARVYDGTAWQELASAQTDLTAYSTTAQMNTAIGAKAETVLSSASFSAVSNITLSSVLSDTYKFYNFYLMVTGAAGGSAINLQFRENTTTKTSGYFVGQLSVNYLGSIANRNSVNNGSAMNLFESSTDGESARVLIGRKNGNFGTAVNLGYENYNQLTTLGGMQNSGMTNFNGLVISSATNLTGSYVLTGIA